MLPALGSPPPVASSGVERLVRSLLSNEGSGLEEAFGSAPSSQPHLCKVTAGQGTGDELRVTGGGFCDSFSPSRPPRRPALRF